MIIIQQDEMRLRKKVLFKVIVNVLVVSGLLNQTPNSNGNSYDG